MQEEDLMKILRKHQEAIG